jgi:hypothetical protein
MKTLLTDDARQRLATAIAQHAHDVVNLLTDLPAKVRIDGSGTPGAEIVCHGERLYVMAGAYGDVVPDGWADDPEPVVPCLWKALVLEELAVFFPNDADELRHAAARFRGESP